jgi:glycosyltransferase involved in cell wall biosynthesis
MNILQFNSMLKGGGTDNQCLKLAQGLRRCGQDVWIAGPPDRELAKIIPSLDLPWHPTPAEGLFKYRLILNTAIFIRQKRFSIVHAHHGRDYWPAILAARLSGIRPRLVITRHLAKSPSSWFSRSFLLRECDALIAVSEFVAKVLREGAFEPNATEVERRVRLPLRGDLRKIQTICGGIDTRRFQPQAAADQRGAWGLAPDHYAFGVVGGYDLPHGKGQREFLAAAARMHRQFPRTRFLIIGRGSLRETLLADITRLGLADQAWLPPYCHDMPAAMNALDCLVHPQRGTEALGLVVCEAMACGKPVIASALDGIPEAFAAGGYGTLVEPGSVGALSQAMRQWADRPILDQNGRQELHRRVADCFGYEKSARRVLALYENLLASK